MLLNHPPLLDVDPPSPIKLDELIKKLTPNPRGTVWFNPAQQIGMVARPLGEFWILQVNSRQEGCLYSLLLSADDNGNAVIKTDDRDPEFETPAYLRTQELAIALQLDVRQVVNELIKLGPKPFNGDEQFP